MKICLVVCLVPHSCFKQPGIIKANFFLNEQICVANDNKNATTKQKSLFG